MNDHVHREYVRPELTELGSLAEVTLAKEVGAADGTVEFGLAVGDSLS